MNKNIIKCALLIICLAGSATACNKDLNMGVADTTSLRVSLTPVPGTIPTEGGSFTSAVVVNQGMEFEVSWTVSVDFNPSWVSVENTTLDKTFTGTYAGDTATYTVKGIKVTIAPNTTGLKRTANLRFTVADNSSIIYTIEQSR